MNDGDGIPDVTVHMYTYSILPLLDHVALLMLILMVRHESQQGVGYKICKGSLLDF
jgi:hypothetical protein